MSCKGGRCSGRSLEKRSSNSCNRLVNSGGGSEIVDVGVVVDGINANINPASLNSVSNWAREQRRMVEDIFPIGDES